MLLPPRPRGRNEPVRLPLLPPVQPPGQDLTVCTPGQSPVSRRVLRTRPMRPLASARDGSPGATLRTSSIGPTPGPVRPKPPTPAVICSAVEGCQMGSDDPGTVGGAGGSCVHNQVVDDTLMHPQCLQTSHPANPVRPVALPRSGDLGVATDPYPYHRKACHGCRQPLLRRSASQEDFIQNQTRPAVAYRCQTCVPGCLGPAEVLFHGHGPVRSELDGACSARRPATVWPGSDKVINLVTARQRPNEVIDAQRHPRRAQQLLQAAGDGSLARARAPVQNHYRHHPPDGTRPRQ